MSLAREKLKKHIWVDWGKVVTLHICQGTFLDVSASPARNLFDRWPSHPQSCMMKHGPKDPESMYIQTSDPWVYLQRYTHILDKLMWSFNSLRVLEAPNIWKLDCGIELHLAMLRTRALPGNHLSNAAHVPSCISVLQQKQTGLDKIWQDQISLNNTYAAYAVYILNATMQCGEVSWNLVSCGVHAFGVCTDASKCAIGTLTLCTVFTLY